MRYVRLNLPLIRSLLTAFWGFVIRERLAEAGMSYSLEEITEPTEVTILNTKKCPPFFFKRSWWYPWHWVYPCRWTLPVIIREQNNVHLFSITEGIFFDFLHSRMKCSSTGWWQNQLKMICLIIDYLVCFCKVSLCPLSCSLCGIIAH